MRFGFRELLLLAVLIALPLSSYWLVFRPVNSEIGQAKAEIEHMRLRLSKVQESTARNQDLRRTSCFRGEIKLVLAVQLQAFDRKIR